MEIIINMLNIWKRKCILMGLGLILKAKYTCISFEFEGEMWLGCVFVAISQLMENNDAFIIRAAHK